MHSIHELIGCYWGHPGCPGAGPESPPEDRVPCTHQASKRVVLHRDETDRDGTEFQFCPRHVSLVMEETDTRTAPVGGDRG